MPARLSNLRTVTALVTPFDASRVDHAALAGAIDRQVRAGMDAVIVCDAIGEGPALTQEERDAVLSTCLLRANGRLAVIAATGSNGTAHTIAMTQRAAALGADGVIVTLPYYSKPTKAGVLAHFRSVASVTHLPLIIDDDPQRVAIEGGEWLLSALADVETIAAVRHGAGRLSAFTQLSPVLRRRYHHYCGDEVDLPAFMACGGHGVVSAAGNFLPYQLAALGRGFPGAAGQFCRDVRLVLDATGGQWDAAVVKAACAVVHGGTPGMRLPLVDIDSASDQALRQALASFDAGADMPLSQAIA